MKYQGHIYTSQIKSCKAAIRSEALKVVDVFFLRSIRGAVIESRNHMDQLSVTTGFANEDQGFAQDVAPQSVQVPAKRCVGGNFR